MSTGDVAALGAAAILVPLLLASVIRTRRSVRVLAASLDESRQETARLAILLETMNGHNETEPDAPESATEPAPPYLSLSKPVIKVRALGAGTSRAAQRLRQGRTARGA